MVDVRELLEWQLGLRGRPGYDCVLRRLVVEPQNSFYGLQESPEDGDIDTDPPIFACRFAETSGYEHILALANEDGRVALQNIDKLPREGSLERFQLHNNAVFDLAWMPGSMKFVTVSGDHTAYLWDAAGGGPRGLLGFCSHTRSVKCVAFSHDEPAVFATGGRDGHALLWDSRAAPRPALVMQPQNWLAGCHAAPQTWRPCGGPNRRTRHHNEYRPGPRAVSVTGLAFLAQSTLATCGERGGSVRLWDLRRCHTAHTRAPLPRASIPYCGNSPRDGHTNLLVDAARTRLYASCMDGVIYCHRVGGADEGGAPEQRYAGHESGSFYIKATLSPDGDYLLSGSSDHAAYLWAVGRPGPAIRLAGHRAEVTCAAWCRAGPPRLVTCSDDARHYLWTPARDDLDPRELHGRAEPALPAPPLPPWPRTPRTARPSRPAPRKSKRCLADVLEAARERKRPRLDSPPELAPEPTPDKENERVLTRASPPPASGTPDAPCEPTVGLPDYVQTGEAPHQRLMSPPKKKPESANWLERMSRERRAGAPGAPSTEPARLPLSPNNGNGRRVSLGEARSPKSSVKCRTLFKYFNVIPKDA